MSVKPISLACALLVSGTQAARLRSQGFFDDDFFGPSPFGGSEFLGLGHHRAHHHSFADDDFGGFGFNQMRDPFKNMEQRMGSMKDSFGGMGGGGEGQSKSFSSSFSSQTGADGQVHSKQQKAGSQQRCHNGVCKITTCKDGKCKETSRKAEDLQKESQEQEKKLEKEEQQEEKQEGGSQRRRGNPFAAMEGMFGDSEKGMGLDSFKKQMRGIGKLMGSMRKFPKMEMPSPEEMKKMAESQGGKVHSESSSMGSSMKCANGKCEKTVCKDGKCKVQEVAQPGAGQGPEQQMRRLPMRIVMQAPPSPQEREMARKQVEAAVDAKQQEYEKKNAGPAFAPKNTSPPPKSAGK